jgi:predicted transcriptional regulator
MPSRAHAPASGLSSFRKGGTITHLLFLYECLTEEPTQLQPIADRLGVTIQAASHVFRQLSRLGLAELREGHYRPTVAGIQWLHAAFGALRDDVNARWDHLHVVRSTRAVALAPLRAGARVVLELNGGVQGARPGQIGASRGVAATDARTGDLVRVTELEGILPIPPGRIRVITIRGDQVEDPGTLAKLRSAIREDSPGLLAAQGLEAYHLVSRLGRREILRFGIAPAALEAARVGVPSNVVLLEEELPRFLEHLSGPNPVPLSVTHLPDVGTDRSVARKRRVR